MSGRQPSAATIATRSLFRACKALDPGAMADALKRGANVHAKDRQRRHPLGAFIQAWQRAPTPPPPAPFLELFTAHGADLARPEGGRDPRHTVDFLHGKDEEMPLLEALSDGGMDLGDRIYDGTLLTRVVRNRAPDMLFCLLGSDFDVDPDAQDEDNQTALHALVDARAYPDGRSDDTVAEMMDILFDGCASDKIPDICRRTALDRFAQEAPELLEAWDALKRERRAMLDCIHLDDALPEAEAEAGQQRRL